MNVYELADKLESFWLTKNDDLLIKAVTMLRQQADRISVLEANYKIQVNIVEKQQDYIDQLEQGLRASIELNKAQAERQTKPLSDEEILQFRDEVPYSYSKDLLDFARAIEERHGIK